MIKSGRMGWTGDVACMGETKSLYGVSVGKPKGKRPLERPRRRREGNIKIDFKEVWGHGLDCPGSG
jgi:hypothetical protein